MCSDRSGVYTSDSSSQAKRQALVSSLGLPLLEAPLLVPISRHPSVPTPIGIINTFVQFTPTPSSASLNPAKQLISDKVGSYEGKIDEEIIGRVEKVAKDKGVSMANVATAWVLSKGCAPIVGLNSEKRVQEAVEAIKLKLTEEEIKYLEEPYAPKRIQGH